MVRRKSWVQIPSRAFNGLCHTKKIWAVELLVQPPILYLILFFNSGWQIKQRIFSHPTRTRIVPIRQPAAVWRRNRDVAGPGQSRAGSGFSKGAPRGRFAAVFWAGAIDLTECRNDQKSAFKSDCAHNKSIHLGQLTIFEPSESADLKVRVAPQTANPSLSQVRIRIISFRRCGQIRQFLPVMPVVRQSAHSCVLEEAVRPAPLPNRRQDKNA